MSKQCYSIVMQTPLGKKCGTLTASHVCLQVKEARNVFQLTGVPCLEGGKTKI